MKTIVWNMTPS